MTNNNKTLYDDALCVKPSEIHGAGLYTSVDIKTDELITIIKGEVIDGDECERREEEEDNVYIFYNGEDCYIDTSNNKFRHLNHHCEFNCEVEDGGENYLLLVAARDISAGEELTIDYGYEEIYEYCNCSRCSSKEFMKV